MPNEMRWRYGDTLPQMMQPATDAPIEMGDLLVVRGEGDVVAFDDFAPLAAGDNATLAYLAEHFAGVAMQSSLAGEDDTIRVATAGVFLFACPKTTFDHGDYVKPHWCADGGMAKAQSVARNSGPVLSIGRCVRSIFSPTTRVLIEILTRGKAARLSPAA